MNNAKKQLHDCNIIKYIVSSKIVDYESMYYSRSLSTWDYASIAMWPKLSWQQ